MYSPPGRAWKSLVNILLVLILLQEEPENLQERSSFIVFILYTGRTRNQERSFLFCLYSPSGKAWRTILCVYLAFVVLLWKLEKPYWNSPQLFPNARRDGNGCVRRLPRRQVVQVRRDEGKQGFSHRTCRGGKNLNLCNNGNKLWFLSTESTSDYQKQCQSYFAAVCCPAHPRLQYTELHKV